MAEYTGPLRVRTTRYKAHSTHTGDDPWKCGDG
jgi:hypothetical protein